MNRFLIAFFISLTLAACSQKQTVQQSTKPSTKPEKLSSLVQSLPQPQKTEWTSYMEKSEALKNMDIEHINSELSQYNLAEIVKPPHAKDFGFNHRAKAPWFSSDEAKQVADIILSFQTPSGGWSKRTDMSDHVRKPGEAFGTEKSYIPTFDNDATTTQIRTLAKTYTATKDIRYKESVIRGIELLITAQYPNGGWPQTFPLRGKYHDYITYNDEVVTNILLLLLDFQNKKENYDFLPSSLLAKVDETIKKGVKCILATQVVTDEGRAIWGAQYNAVTLLPEAARKFEPVALAGKESVNIVRFLMSLDNPSPEIVEAVNSAMDWFSDNKIEGYRWDTKNKTLSTPLVEDPNAGPLWARFIEIGTNKPVFGDRDGSVHYRVEEISRERQINYAWYTNSPRKLFKPYAKWKRNLER